MKKIIILFCLVIGIASCTPKAESNLKEEIREMVSFLEIATPDQFMKEYCDPDLFEPLSETPGYEEIFIKNEERTKLMLLASLAGSLNRTPEFSEDKTVASFEDKDLPKPIYFKKKGERWLFSFTSQ